jgi:hypothetical protein
MLLPENRSPRGYGRNSKFAESRCILPTRGGGSYAKWTSLRLADCISVSSVEPARVVLDSMSEERKPSMWYRSVRSSPNSFRRTSSFIEHMGSGQCEGSRFMVSSGTERRVKMRP